MGTKDKTVMAIGQRAFPKSNLRAYVADMLEGLGEMAADQNDEDLRVLLALTTQAVQTIKRSS